MRREYQDISNKIKNKTTEKPGHKKKGSETDPHKIGLFYLLRRFNFSG